MSVSPRNPCDPERVALPHGSTTRAVILNLAMVCKWCMRQHRRMWRGRICIEGQRFDDEESKLRRLDLGCLRLLMHRLAHRKLLLPLVVTCVRPFWEDKATLVDITLPLRSVIIIVSSEFQRFGRCARFIAAVYNWVVFLRKTHESSAQQVQKATRYYRCYWSMLLETGSLVIVSGDHRSHWSHYWYASRTPTPSIQSYSARGSAFQVTRILCQTEIRRQICRQENQALFQPVPSFWLSSQQFPN
jgi:hypothetical protein